LSFTASIPTSNSPHVPSAAVCRPRRRGLHAAQPAQASFLGVGAPEAVLVGVVALVLFGPKGLAQAAKSLGATLRAFAPTIRELTQVSSELKSTLEEEIGLNDLRDEFQRPAVPSPRAVSTSSLPAADDEAPAAQATSAGSGDAEDSLSELSASMQGGLGDGGAEPYDPDIGRKREEAARMAWGPGGGAQQPAKRLETMSMQDLEAELARRKAAADSMPSELSRGDA